MTWQDFLQNTDLFSTELTVLSIVSTMLFSFLLGLFIFIVYRFSYKGVMYSKTFNVSLIALSMITSAIILAITSNIILSLGMVGALSIVRFRTAIKDPMDVVYLFWAIAVGIISGAGLWFLALISSGIIGILLFVFSKISDIKTPYLLVINYEGEKADEEIFLRLDNEFRSYQMKSKVFDGTHYELTIELRANKKTTNLVNEFGKIENITNVALLSYDGEFAV